MYVCMYVFMGICRIADVCVCMYSIYMVELTSQMKTYKHMQACITLYVYIHIFMLVCTSHVKTYKHIHTCIKTVCIYTYIYAGMSFDWGCVHSLYIYIYIYIHTYIYTYIHIYIYLCRHVIRLGLCPFAKPAMETNKVRFKIASGVT
jgi:hypothetical protein